MSSTVFVPYRDIAPQTTDLRELRVELDRVRHVYGRGSSEGLEAFNNYSRAHAIHGTTIDALRRHTVDEVERFFAQTIPGTDGHVYWDGPKTFRRNDGHLRTPIRWWWEHVHGPIRHGDQIVPVCGEKGCINHEHAAIPDRRERHLLYRDEQLIGAIQVAAMRLGRSPKAREWDSLGIPPTHGIIIKRLGSWEQALAQAGLEYQTRLASPKKCMETLRFAHRFLGRWPRPRELRENINLKAALVEAGLPSSNNVINRHLGPWDEALRKAGKR